MTKPNLSLTPFRCAKCDNEMTEGKVEAVIKKVSLAFEKVQNNDLK